MVNTSLYTVSVPADDTKRFKQLVHLMGWHCASSTPQKHARLYDLETGKYLNEKTMQVIEEARQVKGFAFAGSSDEFKQWAEAL